jgi:zinc finger-containing ubiquitin peptidase 1
VEHDLASSHIEAIGSPYMASSPVSECPFCGLKENDQYSFLLHIETFHAEGESPFVVRESGQGRNGDLAESRVDGSEDSEGNYVDCPEEGCGESILLVELQSHIDLHLAEKMAYDGTEELPDNDDGHSKKIQNPNRQLEAQFSAKLSDAPRNRDRLDSASSSTSERHQSRHHRHRSPGWRDLLNIPSSRSRSSKPAQVSSSGCKRLGVSFPLDFFLRGLS